MKKIPLKFIARRVADYEKSTGESFFGLLERMTEFNAIGSLLQIGLGKEYSDEYFDFIFETEKYDGMVRYVLEGLIDSGFLPTEVEEELKNALPAMKEIRTATNKAVEVSGAKTIARTK